MNNNKKLVVITGASSGFGFELAKVLNKQGYLLLLLARRLEKMEALKFSNTLCKKVDVTNAKEFQDAITIAEKHFNTSVDCLVNNAGVMHLGVMDTQCMNEWTTMIDVNVKGILHGIHSVLPSMKKNQHGTIINISSVAGKKNSANHTVYCGTKFAVHAISEGLRAEVASDNIRVITIAPGAAETELLGHTSSKEIKDNYSKWKENMGGAMSALDVVNSIMFAYQQPQSVCIREIVLAPTKQAE